MKKSRACFADGGQISKADQLIAEMNAKYGVSGNAPAPAPVAQQPAPQPAPKPQSKGLVGEALNLFGNRQKQIDKASGYANGGLIEGIGTPTSDSIPAQVKETGEDIAVSTKERIVSHEQDKLLQRLAKAMGFESVDAFFEAGTGKPVGPTIKGGKRGLAGGGSIYDPTYDELKKIPDQAFPNTMNAIRSSGDAAKASADAGNYGGAIGQVGRGAIGGIVGLGNDVMNSAAYALDPAANALKTFVTGDSSPARQASQASLSANAKQENQTSSLPSASYSNEGRSVPTPITKQNPSAIVDNQFTEGGRNYTANSTSQDGIKRVTGGTSPLYTNIDPAQGVAGLKNQMIGGDAASVNEGLARYANANKIRGEMIANRDKDIPAGGYAPGILGDGGIEAANAEKTQRWRNDELLRQAKNGNQVAIGALLNADGHRDVATMSNETARQNAGIAAQRESNRDQVTMRGQDLNAQNELLRLQGNPLDNQTKQLALGQAQKIAQLQDKAETGDAAARNALVARGILKSPEDKWELGYRKTKDANTGLETQEPVVVTKDFGKQVQVTPQQEYQNAITAAKGDANKIKLIQDRARQNGVIQ